MRRFSVLMLLLLVIGVAAPYAHKGEEHGTEETGETLTGQPNFAPYRVPRLREALFEHLHNKVVHFPIALAVGAALLFLLAFRWPEMEVGARVLVLLGALSAGIAYFAGHAQEEAFEGSPKEWLVGFHEKWGIVTTLSFWVWVLSSYWKPLRKFAWIWGLVVAVLVMITGFYGGLLSHG